MAKKIVIFVVSSFIVVLVGLAIVNRLKARVPLVAKVVG